MAIAPEITAGVDAAASTRRATGNPLNAIFEGVTGMFDALSAYTLGQEASSQAAFRARQAAFRARQARQETEAGAAAATVDARRFTGAQRVSIAKSGVALSGSAEMALAASETAAAMDIVALRHRGKLAEIEQRFLAESASVESKYASRLGTLGAAQSLLMGVGNAGRGRIKLGGG